MNRHAGEQTRVRRLLDTHAEIYVRRTLDCLINTARNVDIVTTIVIIRLLMSNAR